MDNINDHNRQREKAILALRDVQSELIADVRFFQYTDSTFAAHVLFYDHLRKRNFDSIDVKHTFDKVTNNLMPRVFGNTYNRMIQEGLLEFVEDKQLVTGFQDYYINGCGYYNKLAEFQTVLTAYNIEGKLLNSMPVEEDVFTSRSAVEYELGNGKLLNYINYQSKYFQNAGGVLEDLIENALSLVEKIDSEIQND